MVSDDVSSIRAKLTNYSSDYLKGRALVLEEPFDLTKSWRDNITLQNAEYPGCYFLFDKDHRLLYIGKASMGSSMGARVASHFWWDKPAGELRATKVHWLASEKPAKWLRTVVVKKAWEAPSLEEYLITKLQPPLNIAGNR
jgi:excinuclease UvrABC nuclease subunit